MQSKTNTARNPTFRNLLQIAIFPLLSLVGLSACGASGTAGSVALTSTEPGSSLPITGIRPQVTNGWLDDYDTAIEQNVAQNYPALLDLAPSRLSLLCPNWGTLPTSERENFWSALLWSIAGPESARNRTVVYRETSMSIDSVTGQQIRSEGLLQLSYVDVVNHRYTNGDISWLNDRTAALADYASGAKFGNPTRTLLNAYANLSLGVHIVHRLLLQLRPTDSVEAALGRYWATMKPSGSSFAKVRSNLKARMPACSS